MSLSHFCSFHHICFSLFLSSCSPPCCFGIPFSSLPAHALGLVGAPSLPPSISAQARDPTTVRPRPAPHWGPFSIMLVSRFKSASFIRSRLVPLSGSEFPLGVTFFQPEELPAPLLRARVNHHHVLWSPNTFFTLIFFRDIFKGYVIRRLFFFLCLWAHTPHLPGTPLLGVPVAKIPEPKPPPNDRGRRLVSQSRGASILHFL